MDQSPDVSMLVATTRFGTVAARASNVIFFQEGILGFADLKKFLLLEDPKDGIFAWLQSVQDPGIAFPVLEPEMFMDSYKVALSRTDLDALGAKNMEGTRAYCIVTIPEDPTKMTANLKAPVVIHVASRQARQCVLQDNQLAIREPIFMALQTRIGAMQSQGLKRQQAKDVVVLLGSDQNPSKEAIL